jgi:hypothetical protein
LGDLVTRVKAGKEFMSVPQGARVRPALALWQANNPPKGVDRLYLSALSSDTRLLLFPLADIPLRCNGGLGVTIMALPDEVKLLDLAVSDARSLRIRGERRGKTLEEDLKADALREHIGKRAQRGRVVGVRYRVAGFAATLKPGEG